MTTHFTFFDKTDLISYLNPRSGETKFGEKLQCINSEEDLKNHRGEYVIFGITEDVGIRGNLGKPGAHTSWNSFLKAFLNIQINRYNDPGNSIVLGELSGKEWQKKAQPIAEKGENLSKNLHPLVEKIDAEVTELTQKIVSLGKTPIIVGGGHNNAFGNLCGTSKAKKSAVHCLNIDAHTDLRETDFRHSGNGFSFARKKGFLGKYAMMGLHKNYTPEYIFEMMDREEGIYHNFYEELIGQSIEEKRQALSHLIQRLDSSFGLELDCDGIANFPSSAQSPTGFNFEEIRCFVQETKKHNPHYFHLCEAAAQNNPQVGKALSYLVSDFIRK